MTSENESNRKVQEILAGERAIKELELANPLAKRLLSIEQKVKNEGEAGDFGHSLSRRGDNKEGFDFINIQYFNSEQLQITEWAIPENKEVDTLKTRVIYYNNGFLLLGINYTLISDEIIDSLETPGESKYLPNERGARYRGGWVDTFTIEGPVDSLGKNSLAFIDDFLSRAEATL